MKILIFSLMIFPMASHSAPIQIIAFDDDKEYVYGALTPEAYSETLLKTKAGLDQQIVQSLPTGTGDSEHWYLEKISIGLGVTGEVGIGPWKYGMTLKQRFVYSR